MPQQTMLMIKPDAVERNLCGKILARLESERFQVRRLKMIHLQPAEAQRFYAVHEGKPFLENLVAYMSSGPICAAVLEREDAVSHLRRVVGATDPGEAETGTIRRDFGIDKTRNAVHASDAPETAAAEIGFFGLTLDREER
ncbi:MAG: nucleoside-diphosphate kinase [Candidatus Eisenbacteria sp.]|nr:nucleoside-diphosphate kinase [Candidatus Eisenbacteria bacterium]